MSGEYIKRERTEINFAQVPKSALKDPKLSLKAKGLYCYLFSLPEDWKVFKTEVVKNISDGRDSMNAAFKELEQFGYLISTVIKDPKTGKFKGTELQLFINPISNHNGKPVNGQTVIGESAHTNTDNTNNSFLKKKRIVKPRKFIKPTLQQMKDYSVENGYSEEVAKKAFKYYEESEVD